MDKEHPEHSINYSTSPRATCKGPAPCTGSPIEPGTLRYGTVVQGQFGGQTVEWRHWGCVTPDIFNKLSTVRPAQILGFSKLKAEDQTKVLRAIANKRVDPSDVPKSAKPPIIIGGPKPTKTQKRKRAALPASQPLASSSKSSSHVRQPAGPPRTSGNTSEDEYDRYFNDTSLFEAEALDELYVVLKTSIVGVQYYNGMVGAGEQVTIVREPHNKYDRNAFKITNISGQQVGHLPKNVASKLAPLWDRRTITLEGVMIEGKMGHVKQYTLSISIKIYGPADKRDQLEPQLVWATPQQRGFPERGARAPGASQMPSSSQSSSAHSLAYTYVAPAPHSASQQRNLTPAQRLELEKQQAQRDAAYKKHQEELAKRQEALARAAELTRVLSSLEKVDDSGRRQGMLDTLCSTEDVLTLPVHPDPPGRAKGNLMVDLLRHQSQALQWCINRENPVLPKQETDPPVQFWKYTRARDRAYYYNVATKTPQALDSPPQLGRGALVADSMGLGKTLTMLALILATQNDTTEDYSTATLIVVPLSVMSNWEKQISEHCTRGTIKSCTYYGSTRSMSPAQLRAHDVVITTYQTVVADADLDAPRADGAVIDVDADSDDTGDGPRKRRKRGAKGLFNVKWKRIILDEGHSIRNPKTKMAKAVCKLDAQRRWILTGTPIINSPRDLGSMLTFLRICRPLDNEEYFKRLLLRPLKEGDPTGAELLRALMAHICIRRTKEMQDSEGNPLVPLPPVEMTLIPVTLTGEARELYDAVAKVTTECAKRIMSSRGTSTAVVSSNFLSMLTRLRQLALHPGLVPANYLEQLRSAEEEAQHPHAQAPLTPEERVRLQGLLAKAIEECEECSICLSEMASPRITACAHRFCLACITEMLSRENKFCPMDRRPLGWGDIVEPAQPGELDGVPSLMMESAQDGGDGLRTGSSAKIDQLVNLLKLTPPGEKSLVFSQFTSFLDRIAESFEANGISYVRFDGQLNARKRQEVLERFSIPLDESETTVPASMPAYHEDLSSQLQAATAMPPPSSFPLGPPSSQISTLESQSQEEPAPSVSQSGRLRRKASRVINVETLIGGDDDDDDDDFIDGDGVDPDDSDEEFAVELSAMAKGTVGLKGKGKGKGKSGGKGKGRSSTMASITSARGGGSGRGKGKGKSRADSFVVDDDVDDDDDLGMFPPLMATPKPTFDGAAFRGENPRVMLISLKAGALGLNLTVANNVYLMDPWWQEGIESQAIDRCNRIGQKKNVHVYQLIAEDTVESKVIEIQDRKKELISKAFSGMKRQETQREKKEARMHELIELLSNRREMAASQAA